jgi:hypothetical protein
MPTLLARLPFVCLFTAAGLMLGPGDDDVVGRQSPQDPVPAAATQPPTLEQRLTQLRKELATDLKGTAATLRSMDLAKATDTERLQWLRIARDAAVRLGDADWLASLAKEQDPFSEVFLYRVLLAGGHLGEGDLAAAKAELAQIQDVEQVNDRDRRRYHALLARIAQLEGDATAEVTALEHIVDELERWPGKTCQGCHDAPKQKGVPPLLPVLDTWFADRLVVHHGKDKALGERVAAARKAVQAEPQDHGARIRLALLERAAGDRAAAEAAVAPIEWILLPGRSGPKPRMMTTYP